MVLNKNKSYVSYRGSQIPSLSMKSGSNIFFMEDLPDIKVNNHMKYYKHPSEIDLSLEPLCSCLSDIRVRLCGIRFSGNWINRSN